VAAGRLRDDDAVPALLDALRAEDRGLVTDAAWALARITGLELRDRSERWEAWYADEEAWWRDRSDAAFARLDSIDPGENVAALIEISGRRAGRGRLAARIAPQLEAGDAVVAATAARVLGQLGSKVATAELVRALELGDPLASAAAWQALRQVTGKDLPHDPAAWRAAIAP
jgi:HEAT repeat protein